MRKIGLLVCGVLLGSGVVCADASAKEYKCPARIEVSSTEIKPVTGFEAWTDPQTKFYIIGIDLYDGPPHEMAQLKPDNADDPDEGAPSAWTLADSAKGFWMVCLYSDTNARLVKQLDGHEKSCSVKDIRGPEDSVSSGGISLECK
jgi:hypothetical protein